MGKNITYLFGAGASYNSYPIQNELGEKMIELSELLTKEENLKDVIDDMQSFGKKALEFGTIDTYAKKLSLNNNTKSKLEKLKKAVSLFFAIWQYTDKDDEFKKLENRKTLEIDKRYTSLLATILEKNQSKIIIKDNINFVSWNYDLQLEQAFKKFINQDIKWKQLHEYLSFNIKRNENLQICHLNGYHGFFEISFMNVEKGDHNFMDRIKPSSTTPSKIIQDISSQNNQLEYESSFVDYINYAWETNKFANKAREQAQRIFSKTDILIIVGYSFPTFNKEIDRELFEKLEGREIEIYYQDPSATDEFIKELFESSKSKIVPLKNEFDYFHLPYSF